MQSYQNYKTKFSWLGRTRRNCVEFALLEAHEWLKLFYQKWLLAETLFYGKSNWTRNCNQGLERKWKCSCLPVLESGFLDLHSCVTPHLRYQHRIRWSRIFGLDLVWSRGWGMCNQQELFSTPRRVSPPILSSPGAAVAVSGHWLHRVKLWNCWRKRRRVYVCAGWAWDCCLLISPGLPGSLQFLNVDMIAQTPSMKQLVITFIYGKKEFSSLVKILIKYFFIPFFGITCRNKANFPLHLGSISHFPHFLTSE